jgi:hypothetical protein
LVNKTDSSASKNIMTRFNVAFRMRRDVLVPVQQRKQLPRADFLRLRHPDQTSESRALRLFRMEME